MADRYDSTIEIVLPGGKKATVAFEKGAPTPKDWGADGCWYSEINGVKQYANPPTLLRAVQEAYDRLNMPLLT